jgi:two-component system, NarL family, nitrate/nitrite response regulator NarL
VSAANPAIRLVLTARVRLYREELASLIDGRPGHTVVGVAASGDECIAECARLQPAVALVDVGLPSPAQLVGALRALDRAPAVIALAVAEVEPDVIALAEAGAANFITCNDSFADLLQAIDAVARDVLPCSPWVANALLRRVREAAAPGNGHVATLTRREREVADLLEAGLSNKQIGQELCIELPTVKNHVHNVLDKLHVERRADVAALVRAARPARIRA